MHPALKLFSLAIVPLVPSLPISMVMGDWDGGAIAQETTSEKKAEGDRLQQQGIELSRNGKPEATLPSLQQAVTLYRDLLPSKGCATRPRRMAGVLGLTRCITSAV